MKSRLLIFLVGLIIPMVAILLLFPWWNRMEPFVFGFPFNYFWVFLWMFLTAACLYIAFKMDPANRREDE